MHTARGAHQQHQQQQASMAGAGTPGASVSPNCMPAGQGMGAQNMQAPMAYLSSQSKFQWDADYHRTLLEAAQRLPAGSVPMGFIKALSDTMAPLAEPAPMEPDPAALHWFQDTYPGIMSSTRRDVLAVRAYLEEQMQELKKSLGLASEGKVSSAAGTVSNPGHARSNTSPDRSRDMGLPATAFTGGDSVVLLRDGDGYVSTAVLKHQVCACVLTGLGALLGLLLTTLQAGTGRSLCILHRRGLQADGLAA